MAQPDDYSFTMFYHYCRHDMPKSDQLVMFLYIIIGFMLCGVTIFAIIRGQIIVPMLLILYSIGWVFYGMIFIYESHKRHQIQKKIDLEDGLFDSVIDKIIKKEE